MSHPNITKTVLRLHLFERSEDKPDGGAYYAKVTGPTVDGHIYTCRTDLATSYYPATYMFPDHTFVFSLKQCKACYRYPIEGLLDNLVNQTSKISNRYLFASSGIAALNPTVDALYNPSTSVSSLRVDIYETFTPASKILSNASIPVGVGGNSGSNGDDEDDAMLLPTPEKDHLVGSFLLSTHDRVGYQIHHVFHPQTNLHVGKVLLLYYPLLPSLVSVLPPRVPEAKKVFGIFNINRVITKEQERACGRWVNLMFIQKFTEHVVLDLDISTDFKTMATYFTNPTFRIYFLQALSDYMLRGNVIENSIPQPHSQSVPSSSASTSSTSASKASSTRSPTKNRSRFATRFFQSTPRTPTNASASSATTTTTTDGSEHSYPASPSKSLTKSSTTTPTANSGTPRSGPPATVSTPTNASSASISSASSFPLAATASGGSGIPRRYTGEQPYPSVPQPTKIHRQCARILLTLLGLCAVGSNDDRLLYHILIYSTCFGYDATLPTLFKHFAAGIKRRDVDNDTGFYGKFSYYNQPENDDDNSDNQHTVNDKTSASENSGISTINAPQQRLKRRISPTGDKLPLNPKVSASSNDPSHVFFNSLLHTVKGYEEYQKSRFWARILEDTLDIYHNYCDYFSTNSDISAKRMPFFYRGSVSAIGNTPGIGSTHGGSSISSGHYTGGTSHHAFTSSSSLHRNSRSHGPPLALPPSSAAGVPPTTSSNKSSTTEMGSPDDLSSEASSLTDAQTTSTSTSSSIPLHKQSSLNVSTTGSNGHGSNSGHHHHHGNANGQAHGRSTLDSTNLNRRFTIHSINSSIENALQSWINESNLFHLKEQCYLPLKFETDDGVNRRSEEYPHKANLVKTDSLIQQSHRGSVVGVNVTRSSNTTGSNSGRLSSTSQHERRDSLFRRRGSMVSSTSRNTFNLSSNNNSRGDRDLPTPGSVGSSSHRHYTSGSGGGNSHTSSGDSSGGPLSNHHPSSPISSLQTSLSDMSSITTAQQSQQNGHRHSNRSGGGSTSNHHQQQYETSITATSSGNHSGTMNHSGIHVGLNTPEDDDEYSITRCASQCWLFSLMCIQLQHAHNRYARPYSSFVNSPSSISHQSNSKNTTTSSLSSPSTSVDHSESIIDVDIFAALQLDRSQFLQELDDNHDERIIQLTVAITGEPLFLPTGPRIKQSAIDQHHLKILMDKGQIASIVGKVMNEQTLTLEEASQVGLGYLNYHIRRSILNPSILHNDLDYVIPTAAQYYTYRVQSFVSSLMGVNCTNYDYFDQGRIFNKDCAFNPSDRPLTQQQRDIIDIVTRTASMMMMCTLPTQDIDGFLKTIYIDEDITRLLERWWFVQLQLIESYLPALAPKRSVMFDGNIEQMQSTSLHKNTFFWTISDPNDAHFAFIMSKQQDEHIMTLPSQVTLVPPRSTWFDEYPQYAPHDRHLANMYEVALAQVNHNLSQYVSYSYHYYDDHGQDDQLAQYDLSTPTNRQLFTSEEPASPSQAFPQQHVSPLSKSRTDDNTMSLFTPTTPFDEDSPRSTLRGSLSMKQHQAGILSINSVRNTFSLDAYYSDASNTPIASSNHVKKLPSSSSSSLPSDATPFTS